MTDSSQIKKNLLENIEFLQDFQLFLGNIFRMNGALLATAENVCKNDPVITVPIWRILAVLRRQPMTVPSVARYLGLKRQSVQTTVNQMTEKGLVNTEDNPDHKKSYLVSMTQEGNKSLVRVNNYQKTLTGLFVDGFDTSIEELVKVTNFIRKLRENSLANTESFNTKQ